jgi:glycosyltransferase involved in cell wall biosynthesis
MLKIISQDLDKNQLIEIHNRPYLVEEISRRNKFPVSLFFHNDPQTMKGSKSIKEREYIVEKCAAIFCVSEFIKKKFLEGINKNIQNVHVLYNGVERKLKKLPIKKKEVLFVGRLVPEKGVDIYIDAIKPLVSKFTDWSFGLIGSSKLGSNINQSNYSKDIINKFRKIGNQAIFYGFKDNLFVQEKMKDTSIIVIPSLWEEPFGLVAAEAMSNGIAIIASNVGGIPEIIEDNGILIKNVNSRKIQKSLISLIENKTERKLLQKKAWKNFKVSSLNSSKNLDRHRKFILNSIINNEDKYLG